MKIKLSKTQWQAIGKKAGWDDGRSASETLHERALRLIKGDSELEAKYSQLLAEHGEDQAFSKLDYHIVQRIKKLEDILINMQHSI